MVSQISNLVKTLKKQLKVHAKTYADAADVLGLSEASVKRLFAKGDFTLHRLETLCQWLGLELVDLVSLMARESSSVQQLSWQQEEAIVSDHLLLMIAVCVLSGYSYKDLLSHYSLDPHQCLQKLIQLDRLKLIALLPANRIKLMVAADFSWIAEGPIEDFFRKNIEAEFFKSPFNQPLEQLLVCNGLLSERGNAIFQQRLKKMAKEFNELCLEDQSLTLDQRCGTTLVLAMKPWQYSLFDDYKLSRMS